MKKSQIPNFNETIVAAADDERLIFVPIYNVYVACVRRFARNHVGFERRGPCVPNAYAVVGAARGEHGRLVRRPLYVFDGRRMRCVRSLIDQPTVLVRLPYVNVFIAIARGELTIDHGRPVDGKTFRLMSVELKYGQWTFLFDVIGHDFGV